MEDFLDHFVEGVVVGIAGNDMADDPFPINDGDPRLSMNAPLPDSGLLGVFVVVDVDEGHVLVVGSLKPLHDPVFMNAGSAVNRSSEEDENGAVVVDGMGEAFPVEMVRHIHRADVAESFPHRQDRVMADRRPGSLLREGEKPVAPGECRQGAYGQKKKDHGKEGATGPAGTAFRRGDLWGKECFHGLSRLENFSGQPLQKGESVLPDCFIIGRQVAPCHLPRNSGSLNHFLSDKIGSQTSLFGSYAALSNFWGP